MSRSLNKVQLIGNLTRDPEMRYTPSGTAVCTFGIATNRQWQTETGEKKEDVEFHRIVAWSKLAEICSQLLSKGKKVFLEGRLQTRKWTGQDNIERSTTEIVISDMIILDSKGATPGGGGDTYDIPDDLGGDMPTDPGMSDDSGKAAPAKATISKKTEDAPDQTASDDIPF